MELRNSRRSKVELSDEKPQEQSLVNVDWAEKKKQSTLKNKGKDRLMVSKTRGSFRIGEDCEELEGDIFSKTLKMTFFDKPVPVLNRHDVLTEEPGISIFNGFQFKKSQPKQETRDLVVKASELSYNLSPHLRPRVISWLPNSESVMMINENLLIVHQGVHRDRTVELIQKDGTMNGEAVDWFMPELCYLSDEQGFFHLRDMVRGVSLRSIDMNLSNIQNHNVSDFSRYEHQSMQNVVLTAFDEHVRVIDFSSRQPFVQNFGVPSNFEGIERVLVTDAYQTITLGRGGSELSVWDLRQTSCPLSTETKLKHVRSLDFNPKNRSRIIAATDFALHLYNLTADGFQKLHCVPTRSPVVAVTWHEDGRISTVHSSPFPGVCLWKEGHSRRLEETKTILSKNQTTWTVDYAAGSKSLGRAMTVGSFDFLTPQEPIDNFSILSF